MGTIAASVIIGQVEETLLDTTNKTWPAAFHLANLNKAITNTLAVKPDAYVVSGLVTLQASGCMVDAAMSRRMTWALSLQA